MGFAGQVFAARVAVGLAMPSPKAFSQAGAMIGGFASKMYNKLNQQGSQAAQKNLKSAQTNLSNAKSALQGHAKSQQAFLAGSAKKAVSSLQNAYKTMGGTAISAAGAMKGVKAKMGKSVSKKLFKNVSKDMKDAKDYQKMMVNFTNLQKGERKEVMLALAAHKLKLDNAITGLKKLGPAHKEELDLLVEERDQINLQAREYKLFEDTRTAGLDKFNQKHKKYVKDVKEGEEAVEKAQDEVTKSQEHGIKVQEHLTRSASSFVIEMKTNFIDAIRESVSILTAFYYKLSQNTQELIEFERELMNANSVFGVTRDELFLTGDQVVQFGQNFGLEMQNGATGLYQLASAGLSASDSMQVLTETLKLSMAVQGDHNTISKLVTQTLFGFEMEMSEAGLVADKFAYAIQKSLIEYQDLASAVKFALPFFTSTGQSIDQLLGALQILTNRALEAGIAGRGLRQGLAELAESIGDNTARFREFGVEVVDSQGNMLQLTEIAANFSDVLNAGIINDTELLTSLIEDLNVRGATAFVHLVQASDEFTEAVVQTAGAGGQLDEMVRIQNESISSQIQILQNNVSMMFLYRDATYEGTIYLNAFHKSVVEAVASLRDLLVVELADGTMALTAFGQSIQTFAIAGVKEMQGMLANAIPIIENFLKIVDLGIKLFQVYLIPVKMVLKVLDMMGPALVKVVLAFHLMNKLLPITTLLEFAFFTTKAWGTGVTQKHIAVELESTVVKASYTNALIFSYMWENMNIRTRISSIGLWIWENTLGRLSIAIKGNLNKAIVANNAMRGVEITMLQAGGMAFLMTNKQKEKELILYQTSYWARIKDAISRTWENLSIWNSVKALGARFLAGLKEIGQMVWAAGVRIIAMQTRMANTLAIQYEAFTQNINNASAGMGILMMITTLPLLIMKTALYFLLAVATWAVTIPTVIFAGALLTVLGPFILIGLAIGIVIAGLYVMAKRLNEQIDIISIFRIMLESLAGFFVDLIKVFIAPFIAIGEAIYGVLEGPLFKLGLFFKHIGGMIRWLVFDVIVAAFTGDVGHSTLSDVLMAPFNAAKDAIGWLVGVLYSNDDSLWERLKSVWTWLDDTFDLSGKFDAAKESARGLVDWLKENLTWENLKSGFVAIGEGIINMLLAPIRGFEWLWNTAIMGLSGKGFTIDMPGDALDVDVRTPDLSFMKMDLTSKIDEFLAEQGMAEGGYIQMAGGGLATKTPYMVGEKGPEIFMPSSSGRIIPNKDLNTQRVHKMLADSFSMAPRNGIADKINRVSSLTVENLQASSAKMNKTRMGVDTFA